MSSPLTGLSPERTKPFDASSWSFFQSLSKEEPDKQNENSSSSSASIENKEGPVSRGKLWRFMAIVRGRDDLGGLLEAVYIAHLLKERHTHFTASLVVHANNHALAQAAGLFNRIYDCDEKLKKVMRAGKLDILYIPPHDHSMQVLGNFSASHIGITGFNRNPFAPYIGVHTLEEAKQKNFLKRYGCDLRPERTLPPVIGKLELSSPPSWLLQASDYVWLSLFEENELNRFWPHAYVLRLARLLEKAGFALFIPAPDLTKPKNKNIAKKIYFELNSLKKRAPSCVKFIENPTLTERAAGMQRALAVVAPYGPEALLCSLLRRPLLALHDMRSHSSQTKTDTKTDTKEVKTAYNNSGKTFFRRSWGIDFSRQGRGTYKQLLQYMYAPYTQQRHLSPAVKECIEDCPRCEYNSCVEYISPEQVFENLKKILFLC